MKLTELPKSTLAYERCKIIYVADDGARFENPTEYEAHEIKLAVLKNIWYNKRFSTWGMIKYFFTGKEPKKPYNF